MKTTTKLYEIYYKLIKTETDKVHLLRKDGISLCGMAPWLKPVEEFVGTEEEITCEHCKWIINKEKKSAL